MSTHMMYNDKDLQTIVIRLTKEQEIQLRDTALMLLTTVPKELYPPGHDTLQPYTQLVTLTMMEEYDKTCTPVESVV